MMRTHTCGELRIEHDTTTVTLTGWVKSVRLTGRFAFVDIYDKYGTTQVFVKADLVENVKTLNQEDIIKIEGVVKARPENQRKGGVADIELSAQSITILKKIPSLPIALDESVESKEETRLTYRYIDLKKDRMRNNIILRHKVLHAIRTFMDKMEFIDVETPCLTKSTPEGSRDYIVPSRKHKAEFYALPQSPQIYKQLLMVSNFDRYYQIARCFRDEDLRADRQPEFTQLDLEMSFIDEEDIYSLIENLMVHVWKEVLDIELTIPFRRMSYQEAMAKYDCDKPDLRSETKERFAFTWVTEFPMFEFSEEENRYVAMHHPFTSPHTEDASKLHDDKGSIRSRAYDLVLNGYEIGGGSIRIHDSDLQSEVFKALGIDDEQAQRKFGFLLDALKFAPPHGGCAFGIDRLVMLIAEEESIREVIAFPKNKEAKCNMMNTPSPISKEQLSEVHLKQ
jgi:aspartyl-tRNA synthetase